MSKFYVALNLKHDGKRFTPGDAVEIEDKKISAHLLEGGVISKDAPKKEPVEEVEEVEEEKPTKKGKK